MAGRRGPTSMLGLLGMLPMVALLGFFFVLPLLEAARLAAGDTDASLGQLWTPAYRRDLWFTVWTSAMAAAIAVGISFALVNLYHGRRGLVAAAVTGLALLPMLVPHLIAAYAIRLLLAPSGPPLRLLFGRDGPDLITTPVAFVVALVWKFLPFAYVNARAARSSIDDEFLEAAADLGATRWQRARRVLLPLMAPGLLAGGVLVGVLAAAQFSLTLVVYGGRTTTTIPIDVFLLANRNADAAAAGLGLAFAGVVVVFSVIGDMFVRRTRSAVE